MTKFGSAAGDMLRYSFMRGLASDGTIDAGELAVLERLALKDQVVDDAERDVLKVIFSRVRQEMLTPELWQQVLAFKQEHDIA